MVNMPFPLCKLKYIVHYWVMYNADIALYIHVPHAYIVAFDMLLSCLKGSSKEKLSKLSARSYHLVVQFIPTESSPPSLKIIERSVEFKIAPKGYALDISNYNYMNNMKMVHFSMGICYYL